MYTINVYLARPYCSASLRRWGLMGKDSQQLAWVQIDEQPGASELAHLELLTQALAAEIARLRLEPW